MKFFINLWRAHGTKVLGVSATFLGGLESFLALKPDMFELLMGQKAYAGTVLAVAFLITVVGPMVIRRGFTNTGVSGPPV